MNELPVTPGTRIMCPEDCRYHSRYSPVCGYCLPEIMEKLRKKEAEDGDRQSKSEDDGQAER